MRRLTVRRFPFIAFSIACPLGTGKLGRPLRAARLKKMREEFSAR
jgi:hypothetical protein